MEGYIQALINMHARECDNNIGIIAQLHRDFKEELEELMEYHYELQERKNNNEII